MVINMCEYNNVPKIRFKGFTDVWEQRKLGEIINETIDNRGKNPPYYCESGIPVIDNFMIKNNGYPDLKTATRYLDDYLFSNFIRKHNEKDDVLITLVGNGIGNIALFPKEKSVIVQNTIGMRFEHPKKFKYYSLLSKNNEIIKLDRGMAQPSIRQDELKNLDINLPTEKEQSKIESLMTNLDNLITLHQRKCDTLVNAKKSLLEKMFPKNSSNIPEIRFKEFTDVWEQRKLEEISNRFDNLRVPVSANEREKGTTPYYGANGIQDYVKGFTHNGEYVLIAEDGANDLKNYPVKYVNGLFWANNHVHVVQGKEGICDNKYLKYCFTKTNIESLLVGGGRAKLNANIMMSIDLTVPSFNEQVELGRMFYELDNLITLHHRKYTYIFYSWEQRKLADVGNIITGTTPSTSDESNYNGDYLFVSPADINTNRYIEKTNTTLSKKGFESGRILNEGSVLFVSIGSTIGKVAQTKEKSTTNQQINAIEVNGKNNNNFIYSLLEKHSNNIRAGASTQAVPILNKTSFSLLEFNMPKIIEQEKIGQLFRQIDNLITLHQ